MLRDKHNKKNPTQPNPVFPNWVYDRPALLGDFITSPTPPGDPAVAIGKFQMHFNWVNKMVIFIPSKWDSAVFVLLAVFVTVFSVVRNVASGCSGTSSGGGSAVRPGWS